MGFGTVISFLAVYAAKLGIGTVSPFFISFVAAAISTRLFLGHLPDKYGHYRVLIPALLLQSIAIVVLALLDNRLQMITAGTLYGFAHGISYPTMQALIIHRSKGPRSRAIASSTAAFALGVLIAGFVLGTVAKYVGYSNIYWCAAAMALGAAILIRRPKRE